MKIFYLTGSIIFTVLILIMAFGNIGAACSNLVFFFYPVEQSPTIVFLGLAVIGIITGALYHAFIVRLLATPDNEEDENF